MVYHVYSSSIPGPLLPAGFEHFQYANTKGKIWEILSRLVMLGRKEVDISGAVSDLKFTLITHSVRS